MDLFMKKPKRFSWQFAALSICLLLSPLVMNNCSTSKYDTPVTIGTSGTLISPETLNAWMFSGAVNNSSGFGDKVVILDLGGTYSAGHIPGAHRLNGSDIYKVRQEGPAADVNMVPDGAAMDALIQRYGIDEDTVVVFTSGAASPSANAVLGATRAYWTFRYWGFPKEKLKLLDGINFSWNAAYGLTTDVPPAPAASTYSVKNNERLRTDLRASLADMINVAEGKVANAVPVDTRSDATSPASYSGKRGVTSGVFSPRNSSPDLDYVAFEGRVAGAKAIAYTSLFDSANDYRFKSADVLAAMFEAIGINSTTLAHVY
jgi:3-mercaptopyruvate sulfurtransferase SseA